MTSKIHCTCPEPQIVKTQFPLPQCKEEYLICKKCHKEPAVISSGPNPPVFQIGDIVTVNEKLCSICISSCSSAEVPAAFLQQAHILIFKIAVVVECPLGGHFYALEHASPMQPWGILLGAPDTVWWFCEKNLKKVIDI